MTRPISSLSTSVHGNSEFEVMREAADAYLSAGKPLNISAQDLHDSILTDQLRREIGVERYDPSLFRLGPIIIDVRSPDSEMPDVYATGHIPGAIHIPWRQIANWKNLTNLPKDRQIVVYSSTGQIGSQVNAILNVLGYDAVNLKWGITSWINDQDVAPGRYIKARDTVWDFGGAYRAVSSIREPTETYPFPVVENINSEDKSAIMVAAVNTYLSSGKRPNMSARELHRMLHSDENPFNAPFLLDVREDDHYIKGHIRGCLHVFWEDVFKVENLRKLPPDRQILVYCNTGHRGGHVAALLCLLGYDAINLKWGITSWSLSLPGADIAPNRFVADRDCMHYPIVEGERVALPCPG